LYLPALAVRTILDTWAPAHVSDQLLPVKGGSRVIQVWSQWEIEIMTLVHGDAEEELRHISIQAADSRSLHDIYQFGNGPGGDRACSTAKLLISLVGVRRP
jgi:hypothetical protein